jgi:hypothetical protein
MSIHQLNTNYGMEIRNERISNNSLTESLTNGVAERLFRNGKEHAENFFLKHASLNCKDTLIESLKVKISNVRRAKLSKKAAINHITNLFYVAIKCAPGSVFIDGKYKAILGSTIYNDRMFMARLNINTKRPHSSTIDQIPLGYSKHALSRILYRYKPKGLEKTLTNIASMMLDVIQTTSSPEKITEGEPVWFYLPKHGGFLIGKNNDGYVLVTFINETLMSPKQRAEAESTLAMIKQKNEALFDVIINQNIWTELYQPSEYCVFGDTKLHQAKARF